MHAGSRLDSGHYIAMVRSANGRDFRCVDDTSVRTKYDVDSLEKQYVSGGRTFQPYLLFYTKV